MRKKRIEEKRPSALGLHDHLPIEGPGRDDMMQLYAWSLEDAIKAEDEWSAIYGPNVQGRGPISRWMGAHELKELYELYRTKNSAAIIEALFVCSLNSLPIPRWCEMAFLASYRKVRHYKAKSWDDVFGPPHPKGTHLGTKRQEREFGRKVYNRIRQVKKDDPSIPIDGWLFQKIGKEFGIGGKTLTEEYYYKWKNILEKK